MSLRRIYDDPDALAHFVTSSCYGRRPLLTDDESKEIVIACLARQLALRHGDCAGFVVMPEHAHAAVWFPAPGLLRGLLRQWRRISSRRIKAHRRARGWVRADAPSAPVWQPKCYPFHLYTERKLEEKVRYMHQNPVRRGLVTQACDWPFGSAAFYEWGGAVGVPIGWPGDGVGDWRRG